MLLGSSVVVASLSEAAEEFLYRYKDHQGRTVINQSLPPEFVRYGYTILNKSGTVVRTIPPALTEEQIEDKKRTREEQEKANRQSKIQAERDAQLLRTFSSSQDAIRARDRKLAALDVIIDITKGNIIRLKSEYETEEQRAAGQERTGGKANEATLKNIQDLNRQIEDAKKFIKEKEAERKTVYDSFEGDIVRLKQLTGY